MPPRKKQAPQTVTKTQSVTGTKIVIATAALLAAGSLAFAAAPGKSNLNFANYNQKSYGVTAVQPATKNKCGVTSYSVGSSCGKSEYTTASITCYDGTKHELGGPGQCFAAQKLQAMAQDACANRCKGDVPQPFCFDPDGGIALEFSTTVQTETGSYPDRCDPVQANRLLEGICEGNTYDEKPRDCGDGRTCEEGACVEAQRAEVANSFIHVNTDTALYSGTIHESGDIFRLGHWIFDTDNREGVLLNTLDFSLTAEDAQMRDLNTRAKVETVASLVREIKLMTDNGDIVDTTVPDADGDFSFTMNYIFTSVVPQSFFLEISFDRIGNDIVNTELPIQAKLVRIDARENETGLEIPENNILLKRTNQVLSSHGTEQTLSDASLLFDTTLRLVSHSINQNENEYNRPLRNGFGPLVGFMIEDEPDAHNTDGAWMGVFVSVQGTCGFTGSPVGCLSNFSLFDDNNVEIPAHFATSTQGVQIRLEEPEIVLNGDISRYELRGQISTARENNSLTFNFIDGEERRSQAADTVNRLFSKQYTRPAEVGSLIWSDGAGSFPNPNELHWFGSHLLNNSSRQFIHISVQ